MRFRVHTFLAAALTLVVSTAAAPTTHPSASSYTAATSWIAAQQWPDGGFFRADQRIAYSGGLADTLAVLGTDAGVEDDVVDAALERLGRLGPSAVTRPAYAGRVVMALVATGQDPRDFAGHDYVADLASGYQPLGFWERENYANALAALGWIAAGQELPLAAVTWLRLNRCADGGFGWQTACGSTGDVDTTALVLNLLVAAGIDRDDPLITGARSFLLSAQNDAGGFGALPGEVTNANSTGLVLSAIAALGEDPREAPWSRGQGRDPLTRILELQTEDGGFLWRAGNPGGISSYATVQATPGVAGLSYPLPPARAVDECRDLPGRAGDHGRGTPRGRPCAA